MYRQAVKKGFASKRNNKKKNPQSHATIKKFIALALIPEDEIEAQFLILKAESLKKHGKNIQSFVTYFENTWINGYGPNYFCVFDQRVRTNNSIEAYHRVLNSFLKSSLTASAFISKDTCHYNLS